VLRIGVVGVGHLGKIHADIYAKTSGRSGANHVLAAICDSSPEGEATAKKFKVPFFQDFKALADHVDAVSIVAPTTFHREIGAFFLAQGIPCLIEKPLAKTAAEAEALCAAAQKSGALLQVGHVERFNPIIRAASPYFTRPRFIEVHRISPYPFRGTDVGVTLDLMIHDIDLAIFLAKEEPCEIRAAGAPVFSKGDDIANVRMEFPGGCIANITAGRISLKKERKWRIFQDNGYLSLDLLNGEGVFIEKSDALKKGEIDPSKLTPSLLGGATLNFQLAKLVRRVALKPDKMQALEAEILDFISCLTNKRNPIVGGMEGLMALRVAEKIESEMKRI
jgi:predicted dehydrogenase